MKITLDLPEDFVSRLSDVQSQLPRILEFGLRELDVTSQDEFSGLTDILEFLAELPTPEETLSLRPSASLQKRVDELLEKNRTIGLSAEEERLWQAYEYTEHLVRIAKAKAHIKLSTAE